MAANSNQKLAPKTSTNFALNLGHTLGVWYDSSVLSTAANIFQRYKFSYFSLVAPRVIGLQLMP